MNNIWRKNNIVKLSDLNLLTTLCRQSYICTFRTYYIMTYLIAKWHKKHSRYELETSQW